MQNVKKVVSCYATYRHRGLPTSYAEGLDQVHQTGLLLGGGEADSLSSGFDDFQLLVLCLLATKKSD
jgi:hypothetical protein